MIKLRTRMIIMVSITFLFSNCIKEEELIIELPTISTLPITEITTSSAKSGGNITHNGGADVLARGIVWNITPEPTLDNFLGLTIEDSDVAIFQSLLKNLKPETKYYVRAYATNSKGAAYGNEVSFITKEGLYQIEGHVKNSIDDMIKGAVVRIVNNKSGTVDEINYNIYSDLTKIKHSDFEYLHLTKLNKSFTSLSETIYGNSFPIIDVTAEKKPTFPEANYNLKHLEKSSTGNTVITDENGYYKFPEVRNGKYNIVVEREDYKVFNEEIIISGSDVENNIMLEAIELPQIRNVVINPENDNINVTWQALDNSTLKGYNHFEQHFYWHNGEWREDQYYIYPKFSSWNKTNSTLMTDVASTYYSAPCFNGVVRGKVFGVNIDGVQTSENSSTIIRQRNLQSKVKTLASFGLGYTAAIDVPDTSHEIVLHMGYYYQKYSNGVVVFDFDYGGSWVVKLSEKGSSNWSTVGRHGLPDGSLRPSGNHGYTITIPLNEYKGKTIYFKTEPAGTFYGITFKHNLMQYSMDGSNF